MAKLLFPRAALVTPNLDEAARLVGRRLKNPEQAKEAARELATKWKVPFLVKGTPKPQNPINFKYIYSIIIILYKVMGNCNIKTDFDAENITGKSLH